MTAGRSLCPALAAYPTRVECLFARSTAPHPWIPCTQPLTASAVSSRQAAAAAAVAGGGTRGCGCYHPVFPTVSSAVCRSVLALGPSTASIVHTSASCRRCFTEFRSYHFQLLLLLRVLAVLDSCRFVDVYSQGMTLA